MELVLPEIAEGSVVRELSHETGNPPGGSTHWRRKPSCSDPARRPRQSQTQTEETNGPGQLNPLEGIELGGKKALHAYFTSSPRQVEPRPAEAVRFSRSAWRSG